MIYYFRRKADGKWPDGPLVFDAEGNAYGTAISGGAVTATGGCGVVFKFSPSPSGRGRWTETVLHRFNSVAAASPTGALTFDSEGNLYGATLYGGGDDSHGLCGRRPMTGRRPAGFSSKRAGAEAWRYDPVMHWRMKVFRSAPRIRLAAT